MIPLFPSESWWVPNENEWRESSHPPRSWERVRERWIFTDGLSTATPCHMWMMHQQYHGVSLVQYGRPENWAETWCRVIGVRKVTSVTRRRRWFLMLQNALVTTLRVGVAATNEVAHIVVDNTLGRFLNTNPDKVR